MQVIRHGEQLDSSCARASIRRSAWLTERGPCHSLARIPGCSVADSRADIGWRLLAITKFPVESRVRLARQI